MRSGWTATGFLRFYLLAVPEAPTPGERVPPADISPVRAFGTRRVVAGRPAFPGAGKPATMTGVSDAGGAAERFTADERRALSPYFTNLDDDVFALRNLPEVVKGALFARYSRSAKSLRRLFLDEFLDEVPGSRARGGRGRRRAGGPPLRAGARGVRRRLGGPTRGRPRRVRGGLQPADEGARAGPARRVPGAVDPLRAVHRPARGALEVPGSLRARRVAPARAIRLYAGRRHSRPTAVGSSRRRTTFGGGTRTPPATPGTCTAPSSGPRLSTRCGGCCPPPRGRTSASSPRARRSRPCCCGCGPIRSPRPAPARTGC